MDLFRQAKSVRLISHKDRYLIAEEDGETIYQDTEPISQSSEKSAKNAVWIVEFVEGKDFIRLKSCFDTYLTASSTPLLPGVTGKKVVQTSPTYCDPATEWEPLRDGMQVRLKSFWGNFLRPNGGLPPWRNCITHDIPHRSTTRNKLLWDVEVVEKHPLEVTQHNNKFNRTRSRSYSVSMTSQRQNVAKSQEIF
ncbi:UNVERIFIED_CONTAM: hypothetical protein Slati_0104300 [Sesamum latifolium]|uniref:DUF569 domain-containing protein n=1 Tax=Sesamum latifolium TaxID=2727402 RepID=A0AAW2Y8J7_9LAMI